MVLEIGFAMCGSFCTFHKVFPVLKELTKKHHVTPILSSASSAADCRFGTGEEYLEILRSVCGKEPLTSIPQVEPIGPKKLLDALIIAPCTGNTLAKLSCGIADGPVTMAAKSHLRNGRPILIAVSTNDALAGAAENIGRLLARKHFYFVPFGQDSPRNKPTSMVADFTQIPAALDEALKGQQIQPLLLS